MTPVTRGRHHWRAGTTVQPGREFPPGTHGRHPEEFDVQLRSRPAAVGWAAPGSVRRCTAVSATAATGRLPAPDPGLPPGRWRLPADLRRRGLPADLRRRRLSATG